VSFDCLSSVAPVDQTDVDQRWSRSEGPCQFRTLIEYRGRKRNAGHPRLDGSSFVLVAEDQPPSRIELARKRDSLAYRTIVIYVFLRTAMCSPVRASQIAHALKLPRVAVLRRLRLCGARRQAYRVTDKVNMPDLQMKLQRRIEMVAETAKRLSEVRASGR
jgi:hypothetical protein